MWKRRTREENEVLWGVWRAAVHSRLVLIIRVPSDTPGLILSGLWLKIFVNSHLWFIASQKKKKGKKRVLLSLFSVYFVCVCVCVYVTNSVPPYSSMWKSESHLFKQRWLHGCEQHAKSSYIIIFQVKETFLWFNEFGGSLFKYKFTSDLSLCVFGILYIG